jgi:hypothetical protein
MTEEEWHRFVRGGDPQTICTLPNELCQHIGSESPIVRMHHAYALKSNQKHGFGPYEFMMLPITIELGRCICDRPGHLTFFYFDSVVFDRWFHVCVPKIRFGVDAGSVVAFRASFALWR